MNFVVHLLFGRFVEGGQERAQKVMDLVPLSSLVSGVGGVADSTETYPPSAARPGIAVWPARRRYHQPRPRGLTAADVP